MAMRVSALVMYLFNVFHNRPEVIFSLIWSNLFIVSATLSGVETLKYPPFHGICFFDEIFSFFNLVSVFFSKWDFSKTGLQLLVVRYCIIHIFDIKKYNNYIFISEIYYDNSFYSYKFITSFFKKKRIKFVGFITPVVERWLIHLKSLVAAPVLFVLYVS